MHSKPGDRRVDLDPSVAGAVDRLVASAEVGDFGQFLEAALGTLDELVPSSSTTFNELSLVDGLSRGVIHPPGASEEIAPLFEVFERLMRQNPLVSLYAEKPRSDILRWVDVCRLEDFYATELHQQFYAPLNIWHQMVIPVPSAPGLVYAFALNRATPFDDSDVDVCRKLQPFLSLMFGQRQPQTDLVGFVLGAHGWSTLVVDSNGVTFARSGPLRFDIVGWSRLPTWLLSWVQNQETQESQAEELGPVDDRIINGSSESLDVRLLPGAEGLNVLMLRPTPNYTDPRLTSRQHAVLDALATGGTNTEIAARLDISVETVKKHLTAVYRILGVSDRASAIAAARNAGKPTHGME